jgi:hypothetical protein
LKEEIAMHKVGPCQVKKRLCSPLAPAGHQKINLVQLYLSKGRALTVLVLRTPSGGISTS